jgi:adenine-specific DNA methylase
MSEKVTDETESNASETPKKVAIERKLPLDTIDIESQKDMHSGRKHSIRTFSDWFAARPTPAARLAVLGSVLPSKTSDDELLEMMKIGPKQLDSGRAEYVEKKFSQSKKSSDDVDEHYGYPNPNTQSPTTSEMSNLHETVSAAWGGELPTILDPTAGRGIIPFESIRYGLPTKSNELNPVPSLITKVALQYASKIGSLRHELEKWGAKIHEEAKSNIEEYYPTEDPNNQILNSAVTYLIQCDTCAGNIPLAMKWWILKKRRYGTGGDAAKPVYDSGEVHYEHVSIESAEDEYNPDNAPVKGNDAKCPHCGVVAEQEEIREKLRNEEFEYSVYGVSYEDAQGERKIRAGSEVDMQGMRKAAERVKNDFDMLDFLSAPVEGGLNQDQIRRYGMTEWRDIYTPRQLVVLYEYLQAYEKYEGKITNKYNREKAEALLTILATAACRTVAFNSRLTKWHQPHACPGNIFHGNNLAIKKMFADNNLSAPGRGYMKRLNQVIDSYEDLASYATNADPAEVTQMDAADLSEKWDEDTIDVAVIDPPYYSSIMYAELSDVYYVLLKEYLGDTHPSLFDSQLTNKGEEAVANPSKFEEIASDKKSAEEMADEYYENKMLEIFESTGELLSDGGVVTLMFTHRDMDAWDTLTTAFIEAGFDISATHPIKTEQSDRVGVQGKASADSSIFLIGRKRKTGSSTESTLWKEIKRDIAEVAEQEARNIIESGYNISKTDMAIAAYGPTLQKFAQEYPVVNKKGERVRPREALSEAREAVTKVIAETFLDTQGIDNLDTLTRWYILAWLIYENDTFPYDEGNQLGVAAGVDINDIKRPTKIWGKSRGDIQLKAEDDRVQDIVLLNDDSVDNPSSRKYPVDPTDARFTYTIDTVHSAIHVYEREGARAAWDWLTERNLKSNDAFEVAVTALLEVLPEDNEMYETLINLISGETGEYLDINVDHIDMSGIDRQTSLGDHTE